MIKKFNAITCDICKTSLEYYEVKYDCDTTWRALDTTWIARDTGKAIKPWKSMTLNVKFLTEQNEGTFTEPYFDKVKMHICPDCLNKLLDKWPIVAYGAQGHNRYELEG